MEQLARRKRTDYLVVHCSATKPSLDIGVEEITRHHLKEGWATIGYHYVIRRNGKIEDGRDMFAVGAHVFGWNTVTLGICLVGGVKEEDGVTGEINYTNDQMASLIDLLVMLKRQFPEAQICGHHDFPGVTKECPCFDVKEWVKTISKLNPPPTPADMWLSNMIKENEGKITEKWVYDGLTETMKTILYDNKVFFINDRSEHGYVGHVDNGFVALPIHLDLLKHHKCKFYDTGEGWLFNDDSIYQLHDIVSHSVTENGFSVEVACLANGGTRKYDLRKDAVIYAELNLKSKRKDTA